MLPVVDSILLGETDRLYIGEPWNFAIDPHDGSFYIADRHFARVLRYDRKGELLQTYGSPGGGPGEFRSAGTIVIIDENTVAINDYRQRHFSLFERETGEFIISKRHNSIVGNAVVVKDTLWLGMTDPLREHSVGKWDVELDSLSRLGPMPQEYKASMDYFGHCTRSHVAPWADTVLIGYCGRSEVVIATHTGTVLDTISIPAFRRRGVPDNINEIMREEDDLDTRVSALSLLESIHRFPDGRIALVHTDTNLTGGWPAGVMTGELFLTILAPDRSAACVDLRIPTSREIEPKPAFRGDTLAILDRVMVGEELRTWVKLIPLERDVCKMQPIP